MALVVVSVGVRYVERDGVKVLQNGTQKIALTAGHDNNVFASFAGYEPEWQDVPTESEKKE